jgi:hypothetical protein
MKLLAGIVKPFLLPTTWIYSVNIFIELLLYTDSTIDDVRMDWKNLEHRYNPPKIKPATLVKAMSTLSLRKGINMDTIRRGLSSFNLAATMTGSSEMPALGNNLPGEPFQFLFRTTIVLPLRVEKKCTDPGALHLFYTQVSE